MNKKLLQIYKLYNIETFYHLQKLKNNLALISQNINCLKDKLKSYKYIYTLENDIIFDISQHIIYKCLIVACWYFIFTEVNMFLCF